MTISMFNALQNALHWFRFVFFASCKQVPPVQKSILPYLEYYKKVTLTDQSELRPGNPPPHCLGLASLLLVLGIAPLSVQASTIPGPADSSRIPQREEAPLVSPELSAPIEPMNILPQLKAPEDSKTIIFTLKQIRIEGMSVFTSEQVSDLYASYLGREVTLDTVWTIAGKLTEFYRTKGYFLSRVAVPQQKIDNGIVTLQAIEGYVGDAKLAGPLAENPIVKSWINTLESYRPLRADQIESVLLQLNDIPGVNIHATLEPMKPSDVSDGAVRILLEENPSDRWSGSIVFDNNGSRFLGPYEAQIQAEATFLPGERTTVTGLMPFPAHEMQYGGIKQEISLFPSATAELYGSYTHSNPGYSLKLEDIKSNTLSLGAAFDYTLIRQRDQVLTARLAFHVQNSSTDILGTAFTRDYTRALSLGLNYQFADVWGGQNTFAGTLSQGLPILGASPAGQLNISRAGAAPDFTKFTVDASRLQTIGDSWGLLTALSGQWASGPLYTSEQFGYGGQTFGRAYDNSEITGDQGVEGSLELRYNGIHPLPTAPAEGSEPARSSKDFRVQPIPYAFYDVGAVWNGGLHPTSAFASGSSAGLGLRLQANFGLSMNAGFALPLTRPIENPISGNGKSPRYFVSVSFGF